MVCIHINQPIISETTWPRGGYVWLAIREAVESHIKTGKRKTSGYFEIDAGADCIFGWDFVVWNMGVGFGFEIRKKGEKKLWDRGFAMVNDESKKIEKFNQIVRHVVEYSLEPCEDAKQDRLRMAERRE